MSETMKMGLREQMKNGQLLVPYVFDCMSGRMAENAGFETFAFSCSGFALSAMGMPDMGGLSAADVIPGATRVIDFLPHPVIVELENGLAESPYLVWDNVRRLANLGAAAVIIDDRTALGGSSRMLYDAGDAAGLVHSQQVEKFRCDMVPADAYYAKIRAAVDACRNTDCMVIAASNAKYAGGLEEAILRVKRALELGAEAIMCRGVVSLADCQKMAAEISAPKVYDEFSTMAGEPDVNLEEIAALGFNLVTLRYLEKASLYGLMKLCLPCGQDRSLVYNDYHDWDGTLPELDHHIRFADRHRKLNKEIREAAKLEK